MSGALLEALALSINFDRSHLFFPRIIVSLTFVVFVLALLKYRREALSGLGIFKNVAKPAIKRFLALMTLLLFYFWLMGFIGDWYPNMGLGFLVSSIPCLWLFSWFYAPEFTRKVAFQITANAIISPFLAWYVLGQLLDISLP